MFREKVSSMKESGEQEDIGGEFYSNVGKVYCKQRQGDRFTNIFKGGGCSNRSGHGA